MIDQVSLTIEHSLDFKKYFINQLETHSEIYFDISRITDIDISGIQLLVSVIRQARIEKKEIHITGNSTLQLQKLLRIVGIGNEACMTGDELYHALNMV